MLFRAEKHLFAKYTMNWGLNSTNKASPLHNLILQIEIIILLIFAGWNQKVLNHLNIIIVILIYNLNRLKLLISFLLFLNACANLFWMISFFVLNSTTFIRAIRHRIAPSTNSGTWFKAHNATSSMFHLWYLIVFFKIIKNLIKLVKNDEFL